MKFLSILLFLPSLAFGEWTTADSVRQGVFTGLTMIDWAQTRYIAKHSPVEVQEGNPILGKTPSLGRVNNYFAVSIVGHAAISYVLPRPWREGWQYVWIGIEGERIHHNYAMGVKLSW